MDKLPSNEREIFRFSILKCRLIVGDEEFELNAPNIFSLIKVIGAIGLSLEKMAKNADNKEYGQSKYTNQENIMHRK